MSKIHPLSDVQSVNIGNDTRIWQYCVVLPEAQIGENCNICAHVFIENDVVIGNNVTLKTGVELCDGTILEDNVFIGPNVAFTNDLVPRSKQYPSSFLKTIIRKGASIGANSTIVAGHTVGQYALVGAGSLVTKNIPPNTVWYGNPASIKGYITDDGIMLDMDKKDKNGKIHKITNHD